MATKEKAGGKAGAKAGGKGAAKGGAGAKGGGAAAKGKGGKSGKASQPRQAVDFTKRDHAGAGLPVAAPRLQAPT